MSKMLEQFSAEQGPKDVGVLEDVRNFTDWSGARSTGEFIPSAEDDVELRTYLLHCRNSGFDEKTMLRVISSLKRFYGWASEKGIIESNPFITYHIDRPILPRSQIRRRRDSRVADPQGRELARLRALNTVAQRLNSSADVRSLLEGTLNTLVEVMGLTTAWVSLLTESTSGSPFEGDKQGGEFELAAHVGLPPALDENDQYQLRSKPDCHCQKLLREGKLQRAINIVECSRLMTPLQKRVDKIRPS